jgi:malate/lactate dehydrogenase
LLPNEELDGDTGAAFAVTVSDGIAISEINARAAMNFLMIVGPAGAIEVLEPEMSDEEREGLRKSADALNKALERVRKQPRAKVAASN